MVTSTTTNNNNHSTWDHQYTWVGEDGRGHEESLSNHSNMYATLPLLPPNDMLPSSSINTSTTSNTTRTILSSSSPSVHTLPLSLLITTYPLHIAVFHKTFTKSNIKNQFFGVLFFIISLVIKIFFEHVLLV